MNVSDPPKELGKTIAIGCAKEKSFGPQQFAAEILKNLSGICIAGASKQSMMLVLYGIRRIIIRVTAVKQASIKA